MSVLRAVPARIRGALLMGVVSLAMAGCQTDRIVTGTVPLLNSTTVPARSGRSRACAMTSATSARDTDPGSAPVREVSMRPVGVVSTLSSMTPVLILPLLWLVHGDRPAPLAWIGALVAVMGVSAISSGW